jgi:hypothetical protein
VTHPYNSQYNPIELACAFTKTYYNKHINEVQAKNLTESPNKVRRGWEEVLLHFTPDMWKNSVAHCEKIVIHGQFFC